MPIRFSFHSLVMVAAALLTLVATPLVAQDAPAEPDAEITASDQNVTVDPIAPDLRIGARIADILAATGWYDALDVRVENGIVFLNGTAGSEAQKAWARDLANKTDGVVAVVNQIEIAAEIDWNFDPAVKELRRLVESSAAALPVLLLALVVLPLAWYIAHLVARLMRWVFARRISSPFLRSIVARAISFPVFLIGLYIVLQVAGLTQLALSLVGGAGILGIVIGFAFRDIAENFLASLLLSVQRPFKRGDFIKVDGQQGVVKSMTTRSTLLISVEGNHIQIPNATIFKSTIENFTADAQRRGDFVIGVGYDAVISDVQQIILAVLQDHQAVLNDPPPMALIDNLGASTVNMRVYYWFDGHAYSSLKIKSALLRMIMGALSEAGVSMPDEAREVIFPQGVPFIKMDEAAPGAAPPTAPSTASPTAPAKPAAPMLSEAEQDLTAETQDIESQTVLDKQDASEDLLGNGGA
ncbi:mechanosensitive ion channel [Abyssibius alkaniclasticus]|uniref:mechanosensitive ion channel family protein n=1 Tax=Abyssibius alkaniclasticus TaxID=2881234 RepID=UPI002363E2CB|nr:mechanosensitive ion channel family protein [Abyssibius alkaniclasticus]UPH72044.1 mechanosensitive ion channel [Abyssibius alkaniclasticus]